MPRNYLRKAPDRCIVTDEQLEAAKLLISKGASKRKAASQVGLKESTLRKRLKAGKTATSMGRFSLTFTKEQETDIYNYIKQSDDLYYGLTIQNLQKLIYEYAEVNKVTHRFNISTKLAGRDWVYGFLKRFPQLKLRQPVPTSIARAMGFNKTQVTTFYNNLQSLYNKYKFVPSRIYNMDESGVNTVPKKIPKVISVKGKKLVGKIVSAERGQTITLVCAMSATGNYVPPAFIFPRKRMKGYLLNNAPEGSIGMVSDSGFINTGLFLEYLHHFKDNVQPTKDNPVLLILDNHSSHISLNAILYCRDNGIHMLTLPPHSSHKMQPLDRGFFGPLKTKFAYACDKWLSHHPGRVIGQTEIAQLVNEAFQKAASLSNAVSGFKVSGIWPIDTDIFSEEDFAAASVTDMIPTQHVEEVLPTIAAPFQEDPSCAEHLTNLVASTSSTQPIQEVLETTGTTSPSILQNLSISEQDSSLYTVTTSFIQPAQDLLLTTEHTLTSFNTDTQTPLDFLEIAQSCPVANTSSATTASSPTPVASTSKEFIPLSSIQALPKAMSQNRRRKGKKSIIATDSPYKSELEAKKEEEEEKLAKKKIRLDLKERLKTKKTSTKSPETAKKKKVVNKTLKKPKQDENEYFCPLCGEKYSDPPTEDWVECSLCGAWWHELCSSSEHGTFICDTCTTK